MSKALKVSIMLNLSETLIVGVWSHTLNKVPNPNFFLRSEDIF